ncbi:MAG: redoxin family protein [Hyphomonadaceae bacterium]|nr:redoxin family protein [Hyphomonadaceae bacterium]
MFRNIGLSRITAVSIAAIALGLSACNRETAEAAPPAGAKAAEAEKAPTIPDFTLGDQAGASHELYKMTDAKAIVLTMQGVGCPIVQKMTPDLKAVQAAYEAKGVKFVMLNSNNQDTVPMIAAEATSFDIKMPILKDEGQKVAEPLGVVRTAEVMVIDPKSWKIVYHGPLNDRLTYGKERAAANNNFVPDVLDKMLAGQQVAYVHQQTDGCIIDFPNRVRG